MFLKFSEFYMLVNDQDKMFVYNIIISMHVHVLDEN